MAEVSINVSVATVPISGMDREHLELSRTAKYGLFLTEHKFCFD